MFNGTTCLIWGDVRTPHLHLEREQCWLLWHMFNLFAPSVWCIKTIRDWPTFSRLSAGQLSVDTVKVCSSLASQSDLWETMVWKKPAHALMYRIRDGIQAEWSSVWTQLKMCSSRLCCSAVCSKASLPVARLSLCLQRCGDKWSWDLVFCLACMHLYAL